jgi:hypothetical protein
MPVHAVLAASALVGKVPRWDERALTWTDLRALPHSWQSKLAEWRGIYLIPSVPSKRKRGGASRVLPDPTSWAGVGAQAYRE